MLGLPNNYLLFDSSRFWVFSVEETEMWSRTVLILEVLHVLVVRFTTKR